MTTMVTSLSGNEMYCLHLKGMQAGDMVIGNSVFSMGVLGQIGSGFRTFVGGEVGQITSLIHDGRSMCYTRMEAEARKHGGIGITGVGSELIMQGSNVEFLSIGSCVHPRKLFGGATSAPFSSSANAQELYCQIDAGFTPVKFVFGNVAYSIGVGGNFIAQLRTLARGEVLTYSDVFNRTRYLALERLTDEAQRAGANAVIGIKTSLLPFQTVQEMLMIGTACRHAALPPQCDQKPVTSDLTAEELWNLVHLGYMPMQLVLGVSVYSLGLIGSLTSALKQLARGEISELTSMVYQARENALARIAEDAKACGADDVAGIKLYVKELGGGLIEFMAIGTAIKKVSGVGTATERLPVQAVIRDRDTFVNTADRTMGTDVNVGSKKTTAKPDSTKTAWDIIKIILRILAG